MTSLKNSADIQKGLALEAENLKEKLKEAQVFAYILDKANKSMTGAAEAIKERQVASAQLGTDEPLTKEDFAEENKAQDKIVKLQKEASQGLGALLDALKPEEPQAQKPMNPPKEGDQPPKTDNEEKQQPKSGQSPSSAEIKGLISLQEEVEQRMKEFHERCPDRSNRTPEQQAELDELEGRTGRHSKTL